MNPFDHRLTPDLSSLATQIDIRGWSQLPDDVLRQVANRAAAAGVATTLISVFVDAEQPDVARSRAFGLIRRALEGGSINGSRTIGHPTIEAA